MRKNLTRVALIALLFGGLLAACGDDDNSGDNATATTKAESKATTLDVVAKDFSFTTASSVKAGLVDVRLDNQGQYEHQAQLVRINDGVTPQQLQEAQSDPTGEKVLALVAVKGGVNGIAPGAKQSVISNLDAGNYLMLCFIGEPDGTPHVAKGMVTPFTVTGTAPAEVSEPKYDYEIEAKDFSFTVPALKSGTHTIEFKNNGPQPHEATMYKVADGKTPADVQKFLGTVATGGKPDGPPPFKGAGGGPAIAPNTAVFPTLDLQPGTYVLTCFIPDPASHKPHIALGMFTSFEVK
jgi:hypothetical protein